MVAPASANVIGKMANGIADDMLTTTILAAKCPKYVSPAMNTNMFENPIVQDNIKSWSIMGFISLIRRVVILPAGIPEPGKCRNRKHCFLYYERSCLRKGHGRKESDGHSRTDTGED